MNKTNIIKSVEIIFGWVYPLGKWSKRRAIMFALALALFATFMSLFVPTVIVKYDQWVKEAATPNIFRDSPYLPMWGSIVGMVLITIFFVYASVREYRIQKRRSLAHTSMETEIKGLKSRLEQLEKTVK